MRYQHRPDRLAVPGRLWVLGSLLVLLCTLVLGKAVPEAGEAGHPGPLIVDDGSKTDPDFG